MLLFVSILKLIAEIALMALFGQWILGLLAGAKRQTNLFWQILEIMGRPFVAVARAISPKVVLERHHPLVAFCLVLVTWVLVTIGKVQHCVQIGVQLCR